MKAFLWECLLGGGGGMLLELSSIENWQNNKMLFDQKLTKKQINILSLIIKFTKLVNQSKDF